VGFWWDLVVESNDSTRSRKLVESVVESFDSMKFPKLPRVAVYRWKSVESTKFYCRGMYQDTTGLLSTRPSLTMNIPTCTTHNPQLQRPESDNDELVTEEQYFHAIATVAETHEPFQAQYVYSASDDSEEEEEMMHVPSPRDIRAARRSTLRRAFHLTLFFLLTMIIPGDATDAFVAPSIQATATATFHNATSHASCIATHGSTLDLLDFSWILVTWLDVLHTDCALASWVHSSCFLFTSLAMCARWSTSTKPTPTSTHPHKSIVDWNRGYGEFHDLPLCGISRTSRPAGTDTTSTRRRRRRTYLIRRNIRSRFDKPLHQQLPLDLISLVLLQQCQT
jgi:hypothetical protein